MDNVENIIETCKSCKWHDDFTWICCNGYSQYVADVTDNEDSCCMWEGMEDAE